MIDDGVRIGDRLETGHNVFIGEDTVIGDDVHIENNTIIEAGCTLGDRVRVQANCYAAAFTTIFRASFVTCAPASSRRIRVKCGWMMARRLCGHRTITASR